MKRKTMTVKIADKEFHNKVVQIALDYLGNTLNRHCDRILNIESLNRPDLVIHRLQSTKKNSIIQPAGYRFTPSHGSGPTSLEAENASGVAAGLIFLGEHFACNGDFPGRIERQPAFDLRLASAVSPLYTPDPEAVRRALRPDGSMQIWDSWTRQIDTEVPPYADESALELRLRQFETYADTMVRYGANGIVLNGLSHMIDYINLSKTPLLSADHKTRRRHQIYHDFFKKIFGMVKDRDLLLIVISDQFSYLKAIEDWIGPVNAENPRVWQTLYSGITEAFERFPEIDGLMTRYGQHDATQEYRSEDIFHSPGRPVDTHTWGDYTNRPHDIKTLAKLIETVTDASRRRGKLSLFRTWTQTEIDLHSRKDLFQRLVETLPAEIRQNTIFSIKRTLTDFWYHQPVNPTLSYLGCERMIEFECRHEFEGMGMFPAYWGKDSKEAVTYAIQQGVKHIWFWPDAGGWVTPDHPVILPYVSGFDFWIDANVFQIYRLIWDPEESDEKTATDFGTLALGREAGEGVAKILQMAYEACSRIFYTLPFAKRVQWKTISPCWHMPWLGVDPQEIERVLDATGESVAELLEESSKGVQWAIKLEREAERLSAKGDSDRVIVEQIRSSALHLKKFAELMHAFRNLFCSREGNVKEVRANILRLRDCLDQYKSESNMVITEGFEEYLEQVESKVRRV